MVTVERLAAMAKQIEIADELIIDQKDNIAFMEETNEDVANEKAALELLIQKRNLIFEAISKRVNRAEPEQESEKE